MLDFAKFGVGTAYVTPFLDEKIEMYREAGVKTYFGGTLFEKFYSQDKIKAYCAYMKSHDVKIVEVSTGTLDIPLAKRIELVKFFIDEGFEVLSEVGTKDAEAIMSPSSWIHEINSLMEAGSSYVITEGRNSGTAGIFRPSGELRTGLIADILQNCDVDRLIFEAPVAHSQMFFIKLVGANVNLGNINPKDLLLLEAQRLALRSETFYI